MSNTKAKDGVFVILLNLQGNLYLQRDRRTPPKLNLAGGGMDEGETPEETAVREVQEEVGITIDTEHLRLVGIFRLRLNNSAVYLYEYGIPIQGLPAHCPHEVSEQGWYDGKAILNLPIHTIYKAQQGLVRHFLQWREDGMVFTPHQDVLTAPFDRKDGKYFENL